MQMMWLRDVRADATRDHSRPLARIMLQRVIDK